MPGTFEVPGASDSTSSQLPPQSDVSAAPLEILRRCLTAAPLDDINGACAAQHHNWRKSCLTFNVILRPPLPLIQGRGDRPVAPYKEMVHLVPLAAKL